MVLRGFVCVICGGKRLKGSNSNKFKLCSACYIEIRKGVRPRSISFLTSCEVCGEPVNRNSCIPACHLCRHKWYRFDGQRKILDQAISRNDLSKISLGLDKITKLGYQINLKKVEK